jgi:hypothetical protein
MGSRLRLRHLNPLAADFRTDNFSMRLRRSRKSSLNPEAIMLQIIRYSRAKLVATAFIFLASACVLMILFVSDGVVSPTLTFRIFSGDIGHFIVLPILFLVMMASTLRSGLMALGSLSAVAADRRLVVVTTMWRSHSIDWDDLKQISLIAKKFSGSTNYEIKFHRYNASTVSLPLRALALPEKDYEAAFQRIAQAHQKEINRSRESSKPQVSTAMQSRSTAGMDIWTTDASDAEVAGYYASDPKYQDKIEVKLQAQDSFEALACMEVIALALVKVKQDFLSDLQGARSSGAGYHSAAFKLLLGLQNDLLVKINEVDLARWGKGSPYNIYHEGQIIKTDRGEQP